MCPDQSTPHRSFLSVHPRLQEKSIPLRLFSPPNRRNFFWKKIEKSHKAIKPIFQVDFSIIAQFPGFSLALFQPFRKKSLCQKETYFPFPVFVSSIFFKKWILCSSASWKKERILFLTPDAKVHILLLLQLQITLFYAVDEKKMYPRSWKHSKVMKRIMATQSFWRKINFAKYSTSQFLKSNFLKIKFFSLKIINIFS